MDIAAHESKDSKSTQQIPCASVEITMQEATDPTVASSSPLSNQVKHHCQLGSESIISPEALSGDLSQDTSADVQQSLPQGLSVPPTTPEALSGDLSQDTSAPVQQSLPQGPSVPPNTPSPAALRNNITNWASKLQASVDKKLKKFTNPSFSSKSQIQFSREGQTCTKISLLVSSWEKLLRHIQTVLTHIWGR